MIRAVLFLSLLFAVNVNAANITATVNRNIVAADEVFMLTISADENTNNKPDLSVLTPDYNVYSTSSSKSTYVVNGNTTSTTKWQIGLSANKVGKQKIPAIKVGKDVSNEVEIEIKPAGTVTDNGVINDKPEYKIKTEFNDKKSYYVQEQIPFNVIITDVGGLQGSEPVFDGGDDWIVKSLGQPDVISKYEDGKAVREIIFKYVLFAQKSGRLSIPAVRFNGYTISNSGGGIFSSNVLSFNIGIPTGFGFEVPVNLIAPKKQIDIKPVPNDYGKNWWLPAQDVKLMAEYVDTPKFMEGETFSREITLTVNGLIDTQLPEISFIDSEYIKQYPQKSTSYNELIKGELVAVKKVTNIYIPEKSGEITLPEISVSWFDVETLKIKKAIIPAAKIFVEKNPILENVAQNKLNLDEQANKSDVSYADNSDKLLTLVQLVFLVFAVLTVGILIGYYIFKCKKLRDVKPQCEVRVYPDFIIQKAYENDFRALRNAIISWAVGFYPQKEINTLKDVAKAADDECFTEQINIIVDKLYNSKDEKTFNPKVFAESYKKITKKSKNKENKRSPLPE